LCAGSPECVDAADRKKAFARALRTEVDTSTIGLLRTAMARRGRIEKISQLISPVMSQYRPPAGERT